MKKRRNLLFFIIIGLITIAIAGVIIFRTTANKVYTEDTTKEGFINNLMNNVANGISRNQSRQGLIEAYCASTVDAQGFRDPSAPGLYYDPKQSFFVSLLCSQSDDTSENTRNLIRSYSWEDARISGCERDGDMTSCDMSVFLPKLFAIVMNDLSKTKLAQLYSFQGTSVDESIKAFSDTYFGPGDSICGSKNVTYLGATQGSDKEAPCMHPQTRQILAQYIQQAQQMADKTIYIDAKRLITPQGKDCTKDSTQFLVCAFDNTNLNTTSRDSFHNVLYNELLFYKLFVTLAADRLQYPEYNKFRIYSDISTEADQETTRLIQELMLSQEAVMYTEKTLQNMQATFPAHIGLLAYYEDIVSFRKSLLRIYTPLHQLYYKLRNVQQKQ